MDQEWMTIERFETEDQALFHREQLENAGIPVQVINEGVTGPPPTEAVPGAHGDVSLQVPAEEAQHAASVLEEEANRLLDGD